MKNSTDNANIKEKIFYILTIVSVIIFAISFALGIANCQSENSKYYEAELVVSIGFMFLNASLHRDVVREEDKKQREYQQEISSKELLNLYKNNASTAEIINFAHMNNLSIEQVNETLQNH